MTTNRDCPTVRFSRSELRRLKRLTFPETRLPVGWMAAALFFASMSATLLLSVPR